MLEESTTFLESELRRRGVIRTETLSNEEASAAMKQLREDCLRDVSDLEAVLAPPRATRTVWGTADDEWRMQPVVMD